MTLELLDALGLEHIPQGAANHLEPAWGGINKTGRWSGSPKSAYETVCPVRLHLVSRENFGSARYSLAREGSSQMFIAVT